MTIKSGNIPLFFQFYLKLKNEILLGDRRAGDRIPTIDELHEQYGVSQITIRKALVLLEQGGMIKKKQQKGIFVRKDLSRLMLKHGKSYKDEIKYIKTFNPWTLSSQWTTPPPRFNIIFDKIPGTYRNGQIFIIKRLWISKAEPWRRRLSTIFVPAFLYNEIAPNGEKEFIVLEEINNIKKYSPLQLNSYETVHPWICDTESAKLLDIPHGTPIFLRIFTHHLTSGEPLWRSESLTTAFSISQEIKVEFPK